MINHTGSYFAIVNAANGIQYPDLFLTKASAEKTIRMLYDTWQKQGFYRCPNMGKIPANLVQYNVLEITPEVDHVQTL